MNISDLTEELEKNNINMEICLINSPVCREGVLCLQKIEEKEWTVILNERGEYLVKEYFQSEHDACRFFLKKVLGDPTYRDNFSMKDYVRLKNESKELLKKYDFID